MKKKKKKSSKIKQKKLLFFCIRIKLWKGVKKKEGKISSWQFSAELPQNLPQAPSQIRANNYICYC